MNLTRVLDLSSLSIESDPLSLKSALSSTGRNNLTSPGQEKSEASGRGQPGPGPLASWLQRASTGLGAAGRGHLLGARAGPRARRKPDTALFTYWLLPRLAVCGAEDTPFVKLEVHRLLVRI